MCEASSVPSALVWTRGGGEVFLNWHVLNEAIKKEITPCHEQTPASSGFGSSVISRGILMNRNDPFSAGSDQALCAVVRA